MTSISNKVQEEGKGLEGKELEEKIIFREINTSAGKGYSFQLNKQNSESFWGNVQDLFGKDNSAMPLDKS